MFLVPLPHTGDRGGRMLDIVDGRSSAVQRRLRRSGLVGHEPATMATLLTLFESAPPGFVFYDVGANVGLYSLVCSSLFNPSRVAAFEPAPTTAAIARDLARVNDLPIDIEQIALSDVDGTAALYLSATSDASNSLADGFKRRVGEVDVITTRLDTYIAAGHPAPDVIKIDTESFEPQVIAGARATLERHRPTIVLEVLHRRGYDHGEDVMAAIDGLDYGFYDVTSDARWEPAAAIHGDPEGGERDWLLSPRPLPSDFGEGFRRWQRAVAACTADRNMLKRSSGDGQPAAEGSSFTDRARALLRAVRR